MVATAKDKKRQVDTGIWKLEDGRYTVEIRPDGREGKKLRKTCDKLEDARQFKTQAMAKVPKANNQVPVRDRRRLSALVNEWYNLHGYSLKDGEGRLGILLADCKLLNDPIAIKFTAEDFIHFRKMRLETEKPGTGGKKISANTVNHSQAYFCAVFNTLKKLGKWNHPNPLDGLSKLKIDETDLCYLENNQIIRLLDELQLCGNPDLFLIAKICLSIGARWGEASNLKASQVKGGKINLVATKSSKKRSIPISPQLEQEILAGRPRSGLLFSKTNQRKYFEDAVSRAGIELPDGQLTHVLRHTFASHFMINDGNLLKLNKILGHSTLEMTMRYAHLAPAHLTQALTHNPLVNLSRVGLNQKEPV